MKKALRLAVWFCLGILLPAGFDALGVNVYLGAVLSVGLIYFLADHLEQDALAIVAAERRRHIATCAREMLDRLEPPLAQEHYRPALRRLCQAMAAGRKRFRFVAGNRPIEIPLSGF